jgi:hypothetical protein
VNSRIRASADDRASRRRLGPCRLACIIVAGTAMTGPAWSAPKTDVVELENGDRITGEIRSLEYNQLKVSTYHMGTILVEWDKVVRVRSSQNLLLELTDGGRLYGKLAEARIPGTLAVDAGKGGPPESLGLMKVVQIAPMAGQRFNDRFDGYLSVGFDLKKANDQSNLDLAAGLSSRTRIREWSADASASLTNGSTTDRSERYDLEGVGKRFLKERYFYLGVLKLTRNTELDLDLRTLAGGVVGRYFVQTNQAEWASGVGLAVSSEQYGSGEERQSLEGVLTTDFSIFRYDFPETDIGGSLTLLPSLTDAGRVRAEAELSLKYEFVDDLFFELKLYGAFDNKQPGTNESASDYSVTTSLGYSF